LVFLIIVWVGRRPGGIRQPGIPSILDNIVKDSTIYFLVMFTSHLIVEFFILFASVSHCTTDRGNVIDFVFGTLCVAKLSACPSKVRVLSSPLPTPPNPSRAGSLIINYDHSPHHMWPSTKQHGRDTRPPNGHAADALPEESCRQLGILHTHGRRG